MRSWPTVKNQQLVSQSKLARPGERECWGWGVWGGRVQAGRKRWADERLNYCLIIQWESFDSTHSNMVHASKG